MPEEKKLTKNSKAVTLLRKLLMTGEIIGDEDPKTVWDSSPLFKEHKLANFRSCYNRYREEFLEEKNAQSSEGDQLNRKCTLGTLVKPSKKRRFIDLEADSDDESSCKSKQPPEKGSFRPFHLIATWLEPKTTTRRISIAILVPTGISCGDFSVRVTEDGQFLELSVVWPDILVNIEVLHRKWVSSDGADKLEPYHPKLLAFESALKDLRSNANESVYSIARIELPFKVETHIHAKYNLAWRSSTARMVYVDLREAMGTYGLFNDEDEFEEV